MTKEQRAHEIATAALPISYLQYINNGGKPEDFDIIVEFDRLVHYVEEREVEK